MPLAIPAILKELWALRYLLVAIALVGAFAWWSRHEREAGAAAIRAAVEQATAAEHDRRMQTLAWAQQWAQGAIQNVDALRKRDASLQAKVAQLSAALGGRDCLDDSTADGLRRIGADRQPASDGVIEPSR